MFEAIHITNVALCFLLNPRVASTECTPADAVLCDAGTVCSPGAEGYTCVRKEAFGLVFL